MGTGDDFYLLGGQVAFDPAGARLLFDALPPLIHVREGSTPVAPLHWLLDRLVQEMSRARPGAELIARQLAQTLFVYALRQYLDAGAAVTPG